MSWLDQFVECFGFNRSRGGLMIVMDDSDEMGNNHRSNILSTESMHEIEVPCFTKMVKLTLDIKRFDEIERKMKEIEIPEGTWHSEIIDSIKNLSDSEAYQSGACSYQIVLCEQYSGLDVAILKFRNITLDLNGIAIETIDSDQFSRILIL